jgi:hypothetical protein
VSSIQGSIEFTYDSRMSKSRPLGTVLTIAVFGSVLTCTEYALALPYSCQWISEVIPAARIVFDEKDGVGTFKGHLIFKDKVLTTFAEGQFQGYGSNWWRSGSPISGDGYMVVFSGNYPVNGSLRPRQLKGPQRVLLVGLASKLYHGSEKWRSDPILLNAAEGMWLTSKGCRQLHR